MPTFDYRRELTKRELLPALGVGLAAGAAVAYVTQILLRREPIAPRADLVAPLPPPLSRR